VIDVGSMLKIDVNQTMTDRLLQKVCLISGKMFCFVEHMYQKVAKQQKFFTKYNHAIKYGINMEHFHAFLY
jgi:hypothetical protein